MSGTLRVFGGCQFVCDLATTAAAYGHTSAGGCDECSCNGCRNFAAARANVFPRAFTDFLESLGVDPRKDGEVYHNGRLSPGRHSYAGWFHFVGRLHSMSDDPFVELAEGFTAALCHATAPALESLRGLPLVQIEFEADAVPWVLNEPEPD